MNVNWKVLLGRRTAPIAVLAAVMVLAGCGKKQEKPADAPTQVQVVTATAEPFAMTSELPGRVEAVRLAEVRARVAGIVLARTFEEGAEVKAGQVLFQIDPAPFKAELSRAQGEQARAEAQVFEAQALLKRYEPLVKIEAVSPQDFDTARAAVRTGQAALRSARANVETAQLNLAYATVKAPISGRIGRALVTEGALVGQGEATPLARIQQIDTVYADFTQPVGEVLGMRAALAEGRIAAADGEGAAKVSILIDGSDQTREGRLLFSDISVDPTTGQLSLRGEFDNADGVLLPGMYVRVKVDQGVDPKAILVPQRAIKRMADGSSQVFVVDDKNVVHAKPVQTGQMAGSNWHIRSGLDAGDKVIVGGSAQPGQTVAISAKKEEGKDAAG